jgi:hypothetical protein
VWTGDYPAQGINSIAADRRNSGSTLLSIRLAFNGDTPHFPALRSSHELSQRPSAQKQFLSINVSYAHHSNKVAKSGI